MENFSGESYLVFEQAINDYHKTDDVNASEQNPYDEQTIQHHLYRKNWIDAVQWHLEDIIRHPDIHPKEALAIKRRIDQSNQDRTDLVELIDDYFLSQYQDVPVLASATINTESPAWAIDRLSILALKIYHLQHETERVDANEDHIAKCKQKLSVLLEQKADLALALNQLLDDLKNGRKYMKVYKQMKMYNDPSLNPVLYNRKSDV